MNKKVKCLFCNSNAEYVGLETVEGCENSKCKSYEDKGPKVQTESKDSGVFTIEPMVVPKEIDEFLDWSFKEGKDVEGFKTLDPEMELAPNVWSRKPLNDEVLRTMKEIGYKEAVKKGYGKSVEELKKKEFAEDFKAANQFNEEWEKALHSLTLEKFEKELGIPSDYLLGSKKETDNDMVDAFKKIQGLSKDYTVEHVKEHSRTLRRTGRTTMMVNEVVDRFSIDGGNFLIIALNHVNAQMIMDKIRERLPFATIKSITGPGYVKKISNDNNSIEAMVLKDLEYRVHGKSYDDYYIDNSVTDTGGLTTVQEDLLEFHKKKFTKIKDLAWSKLEKEIVLNKEPDTPTNRAKNRSPNDFLKSPGKKVYYINIDSISTAEDNMEHPDSTDEVLAKFERTIRKHRAKK